MPTTSNEQFNAANISTNTLFKTEAGVMGGIFVSSTTAGTIAIYDGTSASGTKIVDTFSPTAGVSYPFPFNFTKGLFVSVGGTLSATVFWV